MAESQDATLLQRRARRRLVGAIALVVFVVIVFPIVLDNERKPVGQDLVIHIPSQDAGKFNTRVLPAKPPEAEAPAAAAAVLPPAAEPPAKAAAKADAPAAKSEAKSPNEPAVAKSPATAEKSTSGTQGDAGSGQSPAEKGWMIPLGAFSDAKNVRDLRAKLTAAGVKNYTEAAKGPRGPQTRVRAGPFASKEEAEKALEKIKAMGVSTSPVVALGGAGR